MVILQSQTSILCSFLRAGTVVNYDKSSNFVFFVVRYSTNIYRYFMRKRSVAKHKQTHEMLCGLELGLAFFPNQ